MKTLITLLLCSMLCVTLSAQITLIPDPNFEQAIIDNGHDSDGVVNGQVLTADISGQTFLDVGSYGILDYTGIEDYVSLTSLYIYDNASTTINLSFNSALEELDIGLNQFASIDLSALLNLKYFYGYDNQLTSLDFSSNLLLEQVFIENNLITSLDFSNQFNLNFVYAENNQITNVTFDPSAPINALYFGFNMLTSLPLGFDYSFLDSYYVNNNNLAGCWESAALNLCGVNSYNFNGNQYDGITDFISNAGFMDLCNTNIGNCCQDTYVPDDAFEQALINLGYDSGALDDCVPTINISSLTSLDVSSEGIQDMTGIEDFVALTDLNCSDNLLLDLDLTANVNLATLNCSMNFLTSLPDGLINNLNLSNLNINTNDLSGCWPPTYSSICASLSTYDFDGNNYDGVTNFISTAGWTDFCTSGIGDCQAVCTGTYIPDNNFEQALIDLGYDSGPLDFCVPTANISGVTYLDIQLKNISDLTGIEDFAALQTLYLYGNNLTTIDLSSNAALTELDCSNNQLTSLDLTGNPNLNYLYCYDNQLSSIDLTGSPNLIELVCGNNMLSSIDLSANTNLLSLYAYSNPFVSIDLTNNANLVIIDLSYGGSLASITTNPSMAPLQLYLSGNNLTSLPYDFDLSNLDSYFIESNNIGGCWPSPMSGLCTQLSGYNFDSNNYDGVTDFISNFGWTDFCANNVGNCCTGTYVPDDGFEQALIDLGYDTAPLDDCVPTANISALTSIDISNYGISDLTGLEDFVALQILDCSDNNLSSIDLTANPLLVDLNFSNNFLTTLPTGFAMLTNLTTVNANNNQLFGCWAPNLSALCSSITSYDFDNNAYDGVSDFISTLGWADFCTSGIGDCQLLCAGTYVPDDNFEQALINLGYDSGPLDDCVPTANINTVTFLSIPNENIVDLTGIEDFVSLESLDFAFNDVVSADLSNLTNLIDLYAFGNDLVSLNLGSISNLTYLYIDENDLGTIDISNLSLLEEFSAYDSGLMSITTGNSPNLYYVDISQTNLSSIDLSGYPGLQYLYASSSMLSSLDLTNNVALEEAYLDFNQLTSLPTGAENISTLAYFYVNSNQIEGCWPTDYYNLCTQLSGYDFDGNVYDGVTDFISNFGWTDFCNNGTGECVGCLVDMVDPTLATCPSNITEDNDFGLCTKIVNYTPPTFDDDCDGPGLPGTLVSGLASGSAFPVGVTMVSYEFYDAAGNGPVTCTFSVTIEDAEDPTIATCPSNMTVGNDAGLCTAVVTYTAPTFDDNCDGPGLPGTLVSGLASGSAFPAGMTTVVYEYTDAANNVSVQCGFTITVEDMEAAIPNCTADISVGSDVGNCSAVVTYAAPTFDDNCDGTGIVGTLIAGLASGSAFPVGITTNTYEYIDAAGNPSSCSFLVQVVDDKAPVSTSCSSNITLQADPGACSTVINFSPPMFDDNCDGMNLPGVQTFGLPSGSTFPTGINYVEFKYTDAAGNAGVCSYTYTVEDNEPPIVSVQDITVTLDASGLASITQADILLVASDNCNIANTFLTQDQFSCADGGSVVVYLVVTDDSGNLTAGVSTVTIDDPFGYCCPTSLYVNASPIVDGSYTATVDLTSDQAASTNGNLYFKAGQLISLDGGFEITAGTDFEAVIGPCP